MKPIHALCASILCFAIAIVLGYFLWQDSTDLAFLIFPEFFDLAGITVATVRSAAFVMLGVDVAIGIMGAALWYCARKADAKLKNAATFDAPKPERRSSDNIVHKSRMVRAAFTLIEILVVIAIISILAALLLVGVVSVLRKGPETRNRNDILQLGVGLDKFKTKYGFYPPSKIKLCPQWSGYNMNNPLDRESVTYLAGMWPNIDRTKIFAWAGPGVPIPATGVTLEGHQCLVFFLGGIPQGNLKAPAGFSNDPTWPTNPNAPDKFKFFDFEGARCEYLGGSIFPSYLDAHNSSHQKKTPFVYFGAYKRTNGYSPFGTSDNAALGVLPYREPPASPAKYINPSTYQLISAGFDGLLGPGGVWTPGTTPTPGKDDIANFHDRNLGT